MKELKNENKKQSELIIKLQQENKKKCEIIDRLQQENKIQQIKLNEAQQSLERILNAKPANNEKYDTDTQKCDAVLKELEEMGIKIL